VPEEIVTDDLMDTFLRYDTVLPNIKSDNKYSSKNIKNGLFDPKTFKSPEVCDEITRLKTVKPTVTMKDQIRALLKRQKLQDIEDKKNIEINRKAFDNATNVEIKTDSITSLPETSLPVTSLPNEPVFLGSEINSDINISGDNKNKFNILVLKKKFLKNVKYHKTNIIIDLPLQTVITIKYYKTNMFIEILQ
jgi:hypothetical protein